MRDFGRFTLLCGATAAALVLGGVIAGAETIKFRADLKGAEEVPPVNTAAKGTAEVTYDTAGKKLTYKVTSSGLSGPATAAHFHGPAEPGKNAGVVVPLTGTGGNYEGSATLTDAQAGELTGGRWYINVHTGANPNGEIRGQVTKAP